MKDSNASTAGQELLIPSQQPNYRPIEGIGSEGITLEGSGFHQPSQQVAVPLHAITVDSLSRKRRASPSLVQLEANGVTITSSSSVTSLDSTEEENAKKARVLGEVQSITGAVNHVPSVAHRPLETTGLGLHNQSRGIIVIPGAHQQQAVPSALRHHQIVLGANAGLHTANGIIPGTQNLTPLQATQSTPVLQLQANQQPAVISLPSQAPSQVAAVTMTSAATTNFFSAPGHQAINSAGKPVNMMHHAQKDTTFTKIFVGGLPYHTTDASLRKYFEQFGEIEEAVVITDRLSSCSKGYGFVSVL